jgi:hypothetical protein
MRVVEQSKDWDLYIPLVGDFTLDHEFDTKFSKFLFRSISCEDFYVPNYVLASSKDINKVYYPYRIGGDTNMVYIELETSCEGSFCIFTFRDLYKALKAYYRLQADDIILMRNNMDFLNVLFQEFQDEVFRIDLNAGSKPLFWADDLSSYWQVNNTKARIAQNLPSASLSDIRGVVIEILVNNQKRYLSCYTLKPLKCCRPVMELQFNDLGTKFDGVHEGDFLFYKMINIPNESLFYTTLMVYPSKRVFQDILGDTFKVISCSIINNDELEFR